MFTSRKQVAIHHMKNIHFPYMNHQHLVQTFVNHFLSLSSLFPHKVLCLFVSGSDSANISRETFSYQLDAYINP